MNIIDFVQNHGGKTFAERPFTPVDAAVISQLSYLKFEHTGEGTLLETMKNENRSRIFEDSRFGEGLRQLYFEAAFSRRYQNMEIRNIRAEHDEKSELTFAAFVFVPEGSVPVVVFRGTDEYMAGWKEDFELAYRFPVTSQIISAEYLTKTMKDEKEFYIAGHSKGGNLAVYSAMEAPPQLQEKIKLIYDLDGPGFMDDMSKHQGYDRIKKKISKLVPEKSFVGQLLFGDTVCRMVESEGIGLLQHDLFKWHIDEFGEFIYSEDNRNYYKPAAKRLNANIKKLSPMQLEKFTKTLFGIFKDAKIDSLLDFSKNWLKSGMDILGAYTDLDDETRRVLGETLSALVLK